jgi:hypothetical protein
VEKIGGFSSRPSGASERKAGGLEFRKFVKLSGSRQRGVVGNIEVHVCRAEERAFNNCGPVA